MSDTTDIFKAATGEPDHKAIFDWLSPSLEPAAGSMGAPAWGGPDSAPSPMAQDFNHADHSVGTDTLTVDAVIANVANIGGDVVIDSAGVAITGGKLSVTNAAGATTVSGGVVQQVKNTTAEVVIDSSGVAITGGKLSVTNGSSVVIIDGTSTMFKVGATGTLTIASGPAKGYLTTVSLDNISPVSGPWPSGYPANNFFTQGQILPYYTVFLVPGTTEPSSGTLVSAQEGFCVPGTNGGTTKAVFKWSNFNDPTYIPGGTATVRFYLFTEATI